VATRLTSYLAANLRLRPKLHVALLRLWRGLQPFVTKQQLPADLHQS